MELYEEGRFLPLNVVIVVILFFFSYFLQKIYKRKKQFSSTFHIEILRIYFENEMKEICQMLFAIKGYFSVNSQTI